MVMPKNAEIRGTLKIEFEWKVSEAAFLAIPVYRFLAPNYMLN